MRAGINAILYYAPFIFEQLGLSENTTSFLATGVVGVVMFVRCSMPMNFLLLKILPLTS
jgi:hypothetical protein